MKKTIPSIIGILAVAALRWMGLSYLEIILVVLCVVAVGVLYALKTNSGGVE